MDLAFYVEIFKANADEKYDEFNRKIVNSGVETIGCRMPFIRKTARKYKGDFADIVALPNHVLYEIDMLKGIVLSEAKMPFEEKSKLLLSFAESIENWSVCDCCVVKPPQDERELYFAFFVRLALSKSQFVSRYGLVSLLANFVDDAHVSEILRTLCNVNYGAYYVDMAAAWLIAECFAKCREETFAFLSEQGDVLPNFVFNKALCKMRESYRISEEDKRWTKTVKRR